MKTIKFIPLLGMVAAVIIACNKENTTPEKKDDTSEKIASPVISISTERPILYPSSVSTELSFEIDSEVSIIDVTASVPAGIESNLDLSGDKKTGKVILTAKGDFPEGFVCAIKATNEGGTGESSVDVAKAYIKLDRETFSAKEAGASFILEVSSNLSTRVSTDSEDWIHIENSGKSNVTITIDRNKTYVARSGILFVTEPKGILRKEVQISQEASINYFENEVAALKALYEATDGPNWTKLSSTTGGLDISTENWCSDKPLNQWYGVELNAEGHVMYLHLSSMGLKGTLPEAIGDLIFCQELWLSGNSLSGTLPSRLGDMQALKDIEADGMELCGDLASSSLSKVASHLKCVSLSGNLFTGAFPEWVGDMPGTSNFWLQDNCLSGKIPDKVKNHPRWSETVLDGSGRTVGQVNMRQREGYLLEE